MTQIVMTILLVVVSNAFGAAQNKAKPNGEYGVQRCTPKLISEAGSKSPDFHFRKGEVYRHSPLVAFEILESGQTAHAILKRNSGVADVDKYALQWVQHSRYNERYGCGTVEITADVTIDLW